MSESELKGILIGMKRLILLFLFGMALYAHSEPEELLFDELVNHEFFDDHGIPGLTQFSPIKYKTVFQWPDNFRKLTDEEIDEIYQIVPEDFAQIFSHCVEYTEQVEVAWSEEKVDRQIRLYIQNPLLEFIYDELVFEDYIDTDYWLFPPFSSFDQRAYCFMVGYGEVEAP